MSDNFELMNGIKYKSDFHDMEVYNFIVKCVDIEKYLMIEMLEDKSYYKTVFVNNKKFFFENVNDFNNLNEKLIDSIGWRNTNQEYYEELYVLKDLKELYDDSMVLINKVYKKIIDENWNLDFCQIVFK